MRGAWIEITCFARLRASIWSLPVRGAWIEIHTVRHAAVCRVVAPRAGSVD